MGAIYVNKVTSYPIITASRDSEGAEGDKTDPELRLDVFKQLYLALRIGDINECSHTRNRRQPWNIVKLVDSDRKRETESDIGTLVRQIVFQILEGGFWPRCCDPTFLGSALELGPPPHSEGLS